MLFGFPVLSLTIWVPIAFGVLYFTAQGLFELATGLWMARRPRPIPREDVP